MSNKSREALEKFSAVDLSRLKFPLDGDSSAIYNSDKEEITIPYWMVAMLLNEVKVAQDMAKSALAEPLRNCDVGTPEEQSERMAKFCREQFEKTDGVALCSGCRFHGINRLDCQFAWAQTPYEEGGEQ